MCVICISPKGKAQPDFTTLFNMFSHNPHGAGYMYVKGGEVCIKKGFMYFPDYYRSIKKEGFTKDDVVIYHCRISTQAGVNKSMCQPFPFTDDLAKIRRLRISSDMGIAHNGIIQITSDGNKRYSDTALFIANILTQLIDDPMILDIIGDLIGSKMVFLRSDGSFKTVGKWTKKDGLIFSNLYFEPRVFYKG